MLSSQTKNTQPSQQLAYAYNQNQVTEEYTNTEIQQSNYVINTPVGAGFNPTPAPVNPSYFGDGFSGGGNYEDVPTIDDIPQYQPQTNSGQQGFNLCGQCHGADYSNRTPLSIGQQRELANVALFTIATLGSGAYTLPARFGQLTTNIGRQTAIQGQHLSRAATIQGQRLSNFARQTRQNALNSRVGVGARNLYYTGASSALSVAGNHRVQQSVVDFFHSRYIQEQPSTPVGVLGLYSGLLLPPDKYEYQLLK